VEDLIRKSVLNMPLRDVRSAGVKVAIWLRARCISRIIPAQSVEAGGTIAAAALAERAWSLAQNVGAREGIYKLALNRLLQLVMNVAARADIRRNVVTTRSMSPVQNAEPAVITIGKSVRDTSLV
jgi:hypothetical protein